MDYIIKNAVLFDSVLLGQPNVFSEAAIYSAGVPAERKFSCVVFDIFGTMLLCRKSGQLSPEVLSSSSAALGVEIDEHQSSALISAYNAAKAKYINSIKSSGNPHPETDAAALWLTATCDAGIGVPDSWPQMVSFMLYLKLYDTSAAAGLSETLIALKNRGAHLGVISNAQFYAAHLLSFFLGGSVASGAFSQIFNSSLCSFSYQKKVAKPDMRLFKPVAREARRITGSTGLFVGNDMYRDILPASKTGFSTCLYTGDAASLRLRKGMPVVSCLTPSYVCSDLRQLLDLVPHGIT
jgi:FMN phosphatase YigB (HAD superfamily)